MYPPTTFVLSVSERWFLSVTLLMSVREYEGYEHAVEALASHCLLLGWGEEAGLLQPYNFGFVLIFIH